MSGYVGLTPNQVVELAGRFDAAAESGSDAAALAAAAIGMAGLSSAAPARIAARSDRLRREAQVLRDRAQLAAGFSILLSPRPPGLHATGQQVSVVAVLGRWWRQDALYSDNGVDRDTVLSLVARLVELLTTDGWLFFGDNSVSDAEIDAAITLLADQRGGVLAAVLAGLSDGQLASLVDGLAGRGTAEADALLARFGSRLDPATLARVLTVADTAAADAIVGAMPSSLAAATALQVLDRDDADDHAGLLAGLVAGLDANTRIVFDGAVDEQGMAARLDRILGEELRAALDDVGFDHVNSGDLSRVALLTDAASWTRLQTAIAAAGPDVLAESLGDDVWSWAMLLRNARTFTAGTDGSYGQQRSIVRSVTDALERSGLDTDEWLVDLAAQHPWAASTLAIEMDVDDTTLAHVFAAVGSMPTDELYGSMPPPFEWQYTEDRSPLAMLAIEAADRGQDSLDTVVEHLLFEVPPEDLGYMLGTGVRSRDDIAVLGTLLMSYLHAPGVSDVVGQWRAGDLTAALNASGGDPVLFGVLNEGLASFEGLQLQGGREITLGQIVTFGVGLLPFGDAFDLFKEGIWARVRGEEPDELVMWIASAGLALDIGWANGIIPDPVDGLNATMAALKTMVDGLGFYAREVLLQAFKNADSADELRAVAEAATAPGMVNLLNNQPRLFDMVARSGDDALAVLEANADLFDRIADEVGTRRAHELVTQMSVDDVDHLGSLVSNLPGHTADVVAMGSRNPVNLRRSVEAYRSAVNRNLTVEMIIDAARNGRDVMPAAAGRPGAWNPDLRNPQPNMTYIVDDRFHFVTDAQGRVVRASGELQWVPPSQRHRGPDQLTAGGTDRLDGDEGGHLFAAMFGGPGESINLVAEARNINRTQFRRLENQWREALLANPPRRVEVEIRVRYRNGKRPDNFAVIETIDGVVSPPIPLRNP